MIHGVVVLLQLALFLGQSLAFDEDARTADDDLPLLLLVQRVDKGSHLAIFRSGLEEGEKG